MSAACASALPNHQSATLAPGFDSAGEVDGLLAAPAGDQAVDFFDVPGEQRTGRSTRLHGRTAQHPAADGGRQRVQLGALQLPGVVAYGGVGLGGPGVQGVGVVAGELRGTGQGPDDAFAEGLLQGGQALVAQPGAGVGGVDVVRVVPDGQGLDEAGLAGGLPVELEEGAAVAAGRADAAAMPESERIPEPRARPSRTVSAWSSRVWPSSTAAAPCRSAAASSAA